MSCSTLHLFQALQCAKHSQFVVSFELMAIFKGGGVWLGLDLFNHPGKSLREVLWYLASSGHNHPSFPPSFHKPLPSALHPPDPCLVLHYQRPWHLSAAEWYLPTCISAVPTLHQGVWTVSGIFEGNNSMGPHVKVISITLHSFLLKK